MIIQVTKDNVTIKDKPLIHKGEYKVHECEFELSTEYTGLMCMAVFKRGYKTYTTDIINNKCDIPAEVLNETGELFIGAYGYTSDGTNLTLRYSPKADSINVSAGSYTAGGNTPTILTPTQYELYSETINKANNLDIDSRLVTCFCQ